MMRLVPLAAVLAFAALAVLAGCTRNGPPAPLSFPGEGSKRPPPALVRQEHLPHPDQVVVQKGDTLYALSKRYDVPLRSIIDANHIDPPFQLVPGTTLDLPQERFHVVQPGDTLYGIARLYSVDLSSLASLNRLSAPYALKSGETLFLPAPVEPLPASQAASNQAEPSHAAASPSPPKPVAASPGAVAKALPAAKPSAESAPLAKAAPPPSSPETAAPPLALGGKGFEWPLEGRIVESYGEGANGTHNDGINIAAREGEPVRAAEAGTVAYAGNELRGYGNLVLIKHAGGYMTAYAHNAQLLVKRGEVVRRGQEIAKAGATGAVSTPQLHFEIRQGTRALDPTTLLPHIEASAGENPVP